MTKSNSEFRIPYSAFFWIVPTLFVFLYDLSIPLVGPDEPRYAQVAREMFERGDWITPTLAGFNWFEKPALLYWLEIASYNLFGVSEFAARFGSALFGLATVGSLWLLGRRIEKHTSSTGFAYWMALIAASTVGIIAFAHGASFDIILTFPMTAALVCYYLFDSERRMAPLIGFYFFIGVALLAKGLVGIVFPVGIVAFYHLLLWKFPSRVCVLSLFWGTALSILVAGVWYFPMYSRNGWEFVDQFFIQHHFQRYTSNKYLHPQPFYFFFWVLPLMTIPWTPFFVGSLIRFVRRLPSAPDSRSDIRVFSIAWLVLPVLFFTFSGSKLPGYILPAVPPAIVLAADYIYDFVNGKRGRKRLIEGVAAATFALLIVAMIAFVPSFAETDSVKGLFAAANERGLTTSPVLMLHGTSHNAEFYAPGRIIRDADGKQKRTSGPPEVRREIEARNGSPILVLVPVEFSYQLKQSEFLNAEVIKDNGEWVLVYVKLK